VIDFALLVIMGGAGAVFAQTREFVTH